VNGHVTTDLSKKITDGDEVLYEGKLITPTGDKIYILLNKPRGYLSTCRDERGRRTVIDLLPKHITEKYRVFPAGRLDYDSSGLLLLTNDGDFSRRVTHPSENIQKIYYVHVDQEPIPQQIEQIRAGSDAVRLLDPRLIEIKIHTGKNRQIRKLVEDQGLLVTSLVRVAIGKMSLSKVDLRLGEIICTHTMPTI